MHPTARRATFAACAAVLSPAAAALAAPAAVDVLVRDTTPLPPGSDPTSDVFGPFVGVDGDSPLPFGARADLNDAGQALFETAIQGNLSFRAIGPFATTAGGPIRPVIPFGGDAPVGDGRFGNYNFLAFGRGPHVQNDAGAVVSIVPVGDVDVPTQAVVYLTDPDGGRTELFREGQPIPGGGTVGTFVPVEISDAGLVTGLNIPADSNLNLPNDYVQFDVADPAATLTTVVATSDGFGDLPNFLDADRQGRVTFVRGGAELLTATPGGATETLSRAGDPVRGGVIVGFSGQVAGNDAGQALSLIAIEGTSRGSVLLSTPGAADVVVARPGDTLPGVGQVDAVFTGALNGPGQVAFAATGDAGGDDAGLFLRDADGSIRAVATPGRTLRDGSTLRGVTTDYRFPFSPGVSGFRDFSAVGLNDAGQVAFFGRTDSPDDPPSPYGSIFLFDPRLGLLEVARLGDTIDGVDVAYLTADFYQNGDLRALNESGQVLFAFGSDDDGFGGVPDASGLALWTPPDPDGGDANLDGLVNLADFTVLAGNFGLAGPDVFFQDADFNGDRLVNLADFTILADNFGNATDDDLAIMAAWRATVPEPAAAGVVALAGGMALRRRTVGVKPADSNRPA